MSISRAAGTVILTLGGVVDASDTEWLRHLLGDLIDGQGNQSIAVDLRQVEEVDRSVLSLLASVSERVLRRGGLFVLCDPSAAVVEGLYRAGLDGTFQVRLTRCARDGTQPIEPAGAAPRTPACQDTVDAFENATY